MISAYRKLRAIDIIRVHDFHYGEVNFMLDIIVPWEWVGGKVGEFKKKTGHDLFRYWPEFMAEHRKPKKKVKK